MVNDQSITGKILSRGFGRKEEKNLNLIWFNLRFLLNITNKS